jgi:hypothetical protein
MHHIPLNSENPTIDTGQYSMDEAQSGEVQPWEQIEAGRYMPRRIRGSCRGRTLG